VSGERKVQGGGEKTVDKGKGYRGKRRDAEGREVGVLGESKGWLLCIGHGRSALTKRKKGGGSEKVQEKRGASHTRPKELVVTILQRGQK